MKEKYNFKIDSSDKRVLIEVSPAIFPLPVILHAVYHFIDEARVIVGEGGKGKIMIALIPNKKIGEADLENLAYEFNIQLISSFVESEESEKQAGVRETIMKAALLPQIQSPPRSESPPEKPSQPKKNSPET